MLQKEIDQKIFDFKVTNRPLSFYKENAVLPRDKVYVFLGSREGTRQTISSHIAIHYFRANRYNLSGITESAYQINIFDDYGASLGKQDIVLEFAKFRYYTQKHKQYAFFLCDITENMTSEAIESVAHYLRNSFNCELPETIRNIMETTK